MNSEEKTVKLIADVVTQVIVNLADKISQLDKLINEGKKDECF